MITMFNFLRNFQTVKVAVPFRFPRQYMIVLIYPHSHQCILLSAFIYIYIYICIILLIYFWLSWVFLAAQDFLHLCQAGRVCFLGVVHTLLTAVPPLVAEHGLQGAQASVAAAQGAQELWLLWVWSTCSVVVVHRLSCLAACGIFLDQGSFSSYPQYLPASESFPMSQLFTWGGQSTGLLCQQRSVYPRL